LTFSVADMENLEQSISQLKKCGSLSPYINGRTNQLLLFAIYTRQSIRNTWACLMLRRLAETLFSSLCDGSRKYLAGSFKSRLKTFLFDLVCSNFHWLTMAMAPPNLRHYGAVKHMNIMTTVRDRWSICDWHDAAMRTTSPTALNFIDTLANWRLHGHCLQAPPTTHGVGRRWLDRTSTACQSVHPFNQSIDHPFVHNIIFCSAYEWCIIDIISCSVNRAVM